MSYIHLTILLGVGIFVGDTPKLMFRTLLIDENALFGNPILKESDTLHFYILLDVLFLHSPAEANFRKIKNMINLLSIATL